MKTPYKFMKQTSRFALLLAASMVVQLLPSDPLPLSLQTLQQTSVYASSAPSPAALQPTVKAPTVQERFKKLLTKNNHLIGWVTLPNTKIDYPVFKTRNNDYYMTRDLNRKKSKAGSVFMDYRNTGNMTDRHTIIYGHNMKNGTMFGTLKAYKSEEFYKKNKVFTYSTLYETGQYEVFSVYVATASLSINEPNFADDAAFDKFLKERISKAMYGTTATVTAHDKVLTLVTCSYEVKNGRLIVHAKKIN